MVRSFYNDLSINFSKGHWLAVSGGERQRDPDRDRARHAQGWTQQSGRYYFLVEIEIYVGMF